MREAVARHFPSLAGFLAMLVIAGSLGATFGVREWPSAQRFAPFPAEAIDLPAPEDDADRDGYADAVDLVAGDFALRVEVTRLEVDRDHAEPYLVLGTQDDQWRIGQGRELGWRHVVDPDPLGRSPGSPSWLSYALRTGLWLVSEPGEGERYALAEASTLSRDESHGAVWPHAFSVNMRDDVSTVSLVVEVWDASDRPHRRLGAWNLEYDLNGDAWREGGREFEDGEAGELGALASSLAEGAGLEISVARANEPSIALREAVARRWAPALFFDSEEKFFPTRGEVLEEFHGFLGRTPDYRTWAQSFNNGRDSYRLLVADFDGDRQVTSDDVILITDILRAGERAPPTVYAHALNSTNSFAVQYWFVSMYNFVVNEQGDEVPVLAHEGDREFVQLTFRSLRDALEGVPLSVEYSQHYAGIRVTDIQVGEPPFAFNASSPAVYVARGSHASYPLPGDDRALRPAFVAFPDVFDGEGERWGPDDYDLELLATQPWHLGYKWGPLTRHSRDLGTAQKPLLQHDFRYPFLDPTAWANSLTGATPDELPDLYQRAEDRG